MKVLVLNSLQPFVRGGAEELADQLVHQLLRHGVEAELMRLPFSWMPAERILDGILACRQFRIFNVDHVIALRFPAYLVPAPKKTLWILHQFRQAYDLADASQSHLTNDDRGHTIKNAVRIADNDCFGMVHRLYVNSPVTAHRLQHYNGFRAEILPPPLNDPELFIGGEAGNYIFAGGRVGAAKRQGLLVEAMVHAPRHLRLVIAGPPDSREDENHLRALVQKHGLADRVTLELGFWPREKIAGYVNGALACAYLPFDEDSFGYVTMEACAAGKPVITTSDAGGVLGLIDDAVTGFVCEPNPKSLGEGMARIAGDRPRTVRMGGKARERLDALGLNWTDTIKKLLS